MKTTRTYVSGNIFMGVNSSFTKGEIIDEHRHNFDHTTVFVSGRWQGRQWSQAFKDDGSPLLDENGKQVWILDFEKEFGPGQWALVEAGKKHQFEALEDGCMLICVYAHRDPQTGEVVQGYNGWMKAYE